MQTFSQLADLLATQSLPIYRWLLDELGDLSMAHFVTPVHGVTSPLTPMWDKLKLYGIEKIDLPYMPKEVWTESESVASRSYRTIATYYFPTGTSYAVMAGITAMFSERDTVLVARNVHVSVVAALALTGCEVVWLNPVGPWFSYSEGDVLNHFLRHPSVTGLILTNPSYEGHCSDLKGIAGLCRRRGVKILVDEALGANWVFHTSLPRSALRYEVDLVLHSLHKRVGSLVPAALLHIPEGSSLDCALVKQYVQFFRSTSPSNAVLLSAEVAIAAQFNCIDANASAILISAVSDAKEGLLRYHHEQLAAVPESLKDPLVLHLLPSSANPVHLAESAYDAGFNYEHADARGVTYVISPFERPEVVAELGRTMCQLITRSPYYPAGPVFEYNTPRMAVKPRDAMRMPAFRGPLTSARRGDVACELFAKCPPGISLIVPGETLTDWHCEQVGARMVRYGAHD